MKPLEEYMLFTNTGAENITVINSQGVRSAQCSMEFDITQKFVPEPSLNFSVVIIFWIILCGYISYNEIYCYERPNLFSHIKLCNQIIPVELITHSPQSIRKLFCNNDRKSRKVYKLPNE